MTRKSQARRAFSPRTLLAGATLLIGVPAVAFSGGALSLNAGYIGPLPSDWFDDESDPCRTEPITEIHEFFIDEYQIDVTTVANDGDPNTYVRCIMKANNATNTCIAGLADGSVVGCRDTSGPEALPSDGDMVYIQIDPGDHSICNVFIGTNDRFGEADPKCRDGGGGTGSGGGSGGGGLGCDAGNSTPLVASLQTNLQEDTCYSFHKVAGTLKIGNWSPDTFSVDIEDSASNAYSSSIGTGNWFDVVGVADGTVYFTVDVDGAASSVSAQVDSW